MKIIWTFDPFEQNKKLRVQSKKLLSYVTTSVDKIKAVYVASHSEINLTTAFDVNKKDRFSSYPKKIIKNQLRLLKLSHIDVAVLPELGISLTSAVRKLATFALDSKADLIVTSTHGKAGFERFMLGSFAETLVHFSQTDLLLYNEKTLIKRTPKKIVYAHDYTRKGIDGIQKVLTYAKKWNAEIAIVHIPKSEYTLKFEGQHESVEAYRKFVKEMSIQVETSIKRRGIHCSTYVERNWNRSEGDLIINLAKKIKADVIIVTAKSGRVTALLGGSVTRNIIRKSTLPTLVLKI